MIGHQGYLLILAVVAVGVFHTIVPDHWVPISVLARTQRWSSAQTARAAALAGVGHTVSTLIIGACVWGAGVVFAQRFGHVVSLVSSAALVVFGLWIAIGAWRELHEGDHHHHHEGEHHHHHHDHADEEHLAEVFDAQGAARKTRARTSLLLILGSSPMIEGIPAFLAASRYGVTLLATMSVLFALSTIATYVVLCVQGARALRRLSFGPLERYGEVISGAVIAIVGAAFAFF